MVRCDQCNPATINGVYCHETGCPNARKIYVPEREQWVLFLECRECGSEVEEGEPCDCQMSDNDDSFDAEADAESRRRCR